MLDLTDFTKEYVEELHRKQNALISTSDNLQYVNSLYEEILTNWDTDIIDEVKNPVTGEVMQEDWYDEDNVYNFFFTAGKVYSVNIYDRVKYYDTKSD